MPGNDRSKRSTTINLQEKHNLYCGCHALINDDNDLCTELIPFFTSHITWEKKTNNPMTSSTCCWKQKGVYCMCHTATGPYSPPIKTLLRKKTRWFHVSCAKKSVLWLLSIVSLSFSFAAGRKRWKKANMSGKKMNINCTYCAIPTYLLSLKYLIYIALKAGFRA